MPRANRSAVLLRVEQGAAGAWHSAPVPARGRKPWPRLVRLVVDARGEQSASPGGAMKTWARNAWACLSLLGVGGLLPSAPAPWPKREEPDAATVKALQRLGATFGRLYTSPDGWSAFYTQEEAEGEGMPAF